MARTETLIKNLQFWAEFLPKQPKLIGVNGTLSHRQFLVMVKKAAAKLQEIGIKPGQVVYLNMAPLHDVIIAMALHFIGAKSAALFSGYQAGLPVDGDWWITSDKPENPTGIGHIAVDADWWSQIDSQDISGLPAPYLWEQDEICYYGYTSGTTGSFKCVGWTLTEILDFDAVRISPWEQGGKVLGLLGWAGVFAAFAYSMHKRGRPIIAANQATDLQKLFAAEKPETIYGSPALLNGFIDRLNESNGDGSFVKQIVTMGGPVSPGLYARLVKNMPKAMIINLYGSTEGSRVAAMRLTSPSQGSIAGAIFPEAELEIVDEEGNALPAGEMGIVRYRPASKEYVNDPEATAAAFKDGWFYCGDTGLINENGHLVLGGRTSEVLNIGGEKIDPISIDHFVVELPGVQDCATFGFETKAGGFGVGIAVVPAGELARPAITKAVLEQFPSLVPLVIVKTDQIPKTQMGKVKRKLLAIQFAKALAESDGAGQ